MTKKFQRLLAMIVSAHVVVITVGCSNPSITESDALVAARSAIETKMLSAQNLRGIDQPTRLQYQKISKLSANSVKIDGCEEASKGTICSLSWRAYKMDETFDPMTSKVEFIKIDGGWALSQAEGKNKD